jgi:type IV pilus assembly protein PilO
MTASKDFFPDDGGEFETAAPTYPTAFGVTFTPSVSGALIAGLGLMGSIYLILNLVLPTFQKYQELQTSRNDKQAQVQQKQAVLQQTEQVRTELALAKKQQTEVLALFANEQTLNTLLLDLNRVVESGNATRGRNFIRARLKRYVPATQSAEVITDGSLGSVVNGKLKRQVVNVELEGTFEQTQAIIRNIERLQPLLLIRDYQSTLVQAAPNQLGTSVRGSGTITTSFLLQALIPASTEEAANAATAANAPKK